MVVRWSFNIMSLVNCLANNMGLSEWNEHTRAESRISSLGEAHFKKLRRVQGGAKMFGEFRVKNHDFTTKIIFFPIAEGGAKMFGVFRVKNHDFTQTKSYFFQLRREARKCLGYFVWKITILRQKIIFSPILGVGRARRPLPRSAPVTCP